MLMKNRNNLASWLTYLQHVGLVDGDFEYSEESFLSNEYQIFKNSVLGQVLKDNITISLEGSIFEDSEKEIIVFSVLNNNTGLRGISGITMTKKFVTIVPILYNKIEIIEVEDDLVFISKRDNSLKDVYSSSGELLIASLSSIQPLYHDQLTYEPQNENVKMNEMTFELKSRQKLKGFLIKKVFPVSHTYIKSIKSDKDSEFETVFGWRNVERLELEDTVSYSVFRDMEKHTDKDCVTVEVYVDIQMFEEANNFENKFFKEVV